MGLILKRFIFLLTFILLVGFFPVQKTYAATLSNVSDTLSTSRPSASAPLTADQAANATLVTVVDNGSMFLASDSAILMSDTGQTENIVNVASMSAQQAGPVRIVYFTGTAANTHHAGTAVVANVTAVHTIKFTTISGIPASGKIIITFPGSGSNIASASAASFSFNGMDTSDPADVKFNGVTCANVDITGSNTITCTATGAVAGGTQITALIGCTAGTTACTTAAPRLINPVKSAAAGTADTWKLIVKTQDASSIDLDSGIIKIGTIDAVQVQATIEPSLTFTIAGNGNTVTDNLTAISGSCGSVTMNSLIPSTATFVDLGYVSNGKLSKAAQTLSVATNGASGYVITATSSGHLINPATGQFIPDANSGGGGDGRLTANDTPVPAIITVGTASFGIHACGARSNVNTDQWVIAGTAPDTGAGTAKFSNGWNSGVNNFYMTLASYSGGPVATENTAVLYGITASGTTPPGIYSNYFTYVATATF